MGSDGTLGLGAIKEKGGATFAQSLSSAKFTGMPGSAAGAGHVDIVAPVEELPGRIIAYLQHASAMPRAKEELEQRQHGALEKVFILLRANTGNDFSQYKRSTIYRRIERRMGPRCARRAGTRTSSWPRSLTSCATRSVPSGTACTSSSTCRPAAIRPAGRWRSSVGSSGT